MCVYALLLCVLSASGADSLRPADGHAAVRRADRELTHLSTVDDILPWLAVRPVDRDANPTSFRDHVIVDEFGRELTLRGACFEAEERNFDAPHRQRPIDPAQYSNGSCPVNYAGNNAGFQEPPICEIDAGKGRWAANVSDFGQNDFAQARALGLNIARLCLSWSSLEYTPGVYNATYIERVAQIVSWAREQGVYVILDLHEDLYSLFIQPTASTPSYPPFLTPSGGQDGAPAWAVETNGWPPLAIGGIGDLNLAILRAFDNLYNNSVIPGVPQGAAPGPGIADHYIGALAALAARFKDEPTVAGFEIINEPLPGFEYLLNPPAQASQFLFPLYRRAVQAITGVRDGLPDCPPGGGLSPAAGAACAYADLGIHDTRHIFFAEPSALRNTFDASFDLMGRWSNYTNIVFTPHVYTHVFTIDVEAPWLNITNYPPSWAYAYETAWLEANRMGAAVFVSEFGCGALDDVKTVIPTLDEAERHGTGGTIWSWKTNCGDGTDCTDPWSMFAAPIGNASVAPNGPLFPQRERMMSRIHSRGTLGETLVALYNVSTRGYVLSANVTAAAWWGLTMRARTFDAALGDASPWARGPWSDVRAHTDARPFSRASLTANGSVTEIYIPRSLSSVTPVAVSNVQLLGTVAWPDGSRSSFFRPLAPGVYSLGVPPSDSAPDFDIAASVAAAYEARPTALTVSGGAAVGAVAAADAYSRYASSLVANISLARVALQGSGFELP